MSDEVVKLSYLDNGIAIIAMEDQANKNTFSMPLIQGLKTAFAQINANSTSKVVIIHGYDNFFCCGGTREELFELTDGKKNFTDFGFYRLLLDCPVPVIAAIQGHAVGAGFAFAASADLWVIAEEAFYTANFMKYGFTPGFGATYFLPKKLGVCVAANMMFGAQNYQGSQLKDWGVTAHFAKKTEVIKTAINLAQKIADQPRNMIIELKKKLSAADQQALPQFIADEIAMHEITFKLPEVKNKIIELLG